jgi:Bacterial transcriptional activator domain
MGRRLIRDLLPGLAAVLLLLGLLAGVPFALVTLVGWPLPRRLPSLGLETLRAPVDATTVVNVLALVVWVAWAQFTACVLVEVKAAVAGAGLPARVPLGGLNQLLARQLVAAALLLTASAAGLAPTRTGLGGAVPPRPPAVAAAAARETLAADPGDATTAPQVVDTGPEAAAARNHAPRARKLYVVQPPKGRHHESLWEIAERHLGDGRRYPEIFQLNQGREQPDGDRLTLASLIRPGWVLLMPSDAVGVRVVHEQATGGDAAGARPAEREVGDGSGGPTGDAAEAPAGTSFAERQGAGGTGPAERQADRRQEPPGLPGPELAGAVLLAAGLLTALGRRRRQQLWHRAFGRRIRLPGGDGAAAEEAIRIGADPAAARLLDLGLRSLSRTLRQAGRSLPTVYGARLGDGGIELALAPAEPQAPEPWTAVAEGAIWRLSATAAEDLDERALRDVLAPYPGLVSLGRDHSGWVLVDLEAAYGVVSVLGPAERCQEVLAAMAAELATNRWSDHMGVTLVGFGEDLALLAPERVRAVATLDEVLPELEARAEETRQALAAAGVDSVLTGRCRGISGEAWMPHFVLVARQPAPRDRERLLRLSGIWQRTPTGYLVAGDIPGAAWSLHVSDDGRASLPLLGLEVDAQRLPGAQYRAVVELFRTATDLAAAPAAPRPPGAGAPGAPAAVMADLEGQRAVEVRLLGQVEVRAPGALEQGRAEACTEALVYLATHPDGVHPTVLGGAVWPRGVSAAVRDATVARLRDWLGRDAAGRPNLVTGEDGRLRLGPEVRSDWAVFETLVRLAEADPSGERAHLQRALSLVRGPLLEGRRPRRYAWLAREELEYEVPARIADAAHRLVELRLAGSDAHGAAAAARAGLRGAPDEEGLWRDLLRATHATGDTAKLRAVVGELERRVAADPALEELHAETEALIDELLPSWRLSLAT